MAVITYIAVDRGELAAGHTAATQYQIETIFEDSPRRTRVKGARAETEDGAPEAWVSAFQFTYDLRTDLVVSADRELWREFFSSVAGAERFQIDFTGTIASPGPSIDVWLESDQWLEQQIRSAGYRYAFRVKRWP